MNELGDIIIILIVFRVFFGILGACGMARRRMISEGIVRISTRNEWLF